MKTALIVAGALGAGILVYAATRPAQTPTPTSSTSQTLGAFVGALLGGVAGGDSKSESTGALGGIADLGTRLGNTLSDAFTGLWNPPTNTDGGGQAYQTLGIA